MVPQLMCGNSLSTILLIQLAIVHVLDVTLQLDYVHLIANLQFGLPGMDGLNARRVVEREKGTEIDYPIYVLLCLPPRNFPTFRRY